MGSNFHSNVSISECQQPKKVGKVVGTILLGALALVLSVLFPQASIIIAAFAALMFAAKKQLPCGIFFGVNMNSQHKTSWNKQYSVQIFV
jgi:hypothetical protein